eukprot:2865840-Amphidinium_carterae.2
MAATVRRAPVAASGICTAQLIASGCSGARACLNHAWVLQWIWRGRFRILMRVQTLDVLGGENSREMREW